MPSGEEGIAFDRSLEMEIVGKEEIVTYVRLDGARSIVVVEDRHSVPPPLFDSRRTRPQIV